ncbi:MAG: DUF368 domain-containing protein [Dehalococcoidia bacterium]
MKYYLILVLKGLGIGAANVIPGVSGGTIALITGIFEKLIDSIKSFDTHAAGLLLRGRLKAFAEHTNLFFLIAVFAGVAVAIVALARILDPLFDDYPVYVWAFFFGLILASVYFVGKTVHRWDVAVIVSFAIGTACAVAVSLISDVAGANEASWYVFLCGIVAICSMILPGLSGSYVLLLMGNYELVVVDAVNDLDVSILIPMIVGAVAGLLTFSRLLSWIFKRYRDRTIALLTGFIFGSLSILWPWKEEITATLSDGTEKVTGYERYMPDSFGGEVLGAIGLMIAGIVVIWIFEKLAANRSG